MQSQHGQEAIYEMLWDCKFCSQKKLLGVTHRFCANCGGPQDPNARYFPPDHEKVAVQNHQFVGADLHCPACNQPMSRNAACCTNCGSPIDKGKQVALQADVYVPPPAYQAPPPGAPAKKSNTGLIVLGVFGGLFALIVVLVLVAVLWKKEGVFAVTGHTWDRSIAIERFDATKKSVWCDEKPAAARELGRHKEQHGTSKTPDGETCATRKKDQGNGTFKEVKECTPKFKETPVMADKCDVEVTEWHASRTATEKGASVTDAPRWPQTNAKGGTCLGCEREGTKTEHYTVLFTDAKSSTKAQCDVPQDKWSGAFPDGSKWKGNVSVLTGALDCDALQKQ